MSVMASQITGVPIVCSTVCSGAHQRKYQSSASLAFVRGIHRWPVNFPCKGPVTRKMFPFDDVIMSTLFKIKLLTFCAGNSPVTDEFPAKRPVTWSFDVFITRDSEVIMFSPCVFVCVCVSVYVCHDVCPDDLTLKDWCHTNNILQVHCWECLVVQVMFHTFMTSLMTSPGYKIGQIFKLIYLRQYLLLS